MSNVQEGPGWWLASDGRWYPPETHPSVAASWMPLNPIPAPRTDAPGEECAPLPPLSTVVPDYVSLSRDSIAPMPQIATSVPLPAPDDRR
jgi:hypothetical protein